VSKGGKGPFKVMYRFQMMVLVKAMSRQSASKQAALK